jgi:hypothetical protein
MKEAAVLVLVAVVIVGGIGIWLANGGSVPFLSSQPAGIQPASDVPPSEAQADAAKKAEEAKAVKKPAKASKKAAAPPVAEAAPEPVVVVPVAEVVVAPPVPKQFPSAREISVGAEREIISEKFGTPSLATTTTSDDGRVMETLVYARKSGRDVTVIRIEDGKVLSAYSR